MTPPFRSHHRWRRVTPALALLGALVVAGAEPSGAAYGPPTKPGAAPAVTMPLAGAITTNDLTWSTVLMGKNDGDFDLFWQLFALDPTSSRVRLVTPPGVADNGGLMLAPTSTSGAVVGFGASQGLKFSPLATSTNAGTTWEPGGLPEPLVAAPDVLAASGAHALALVGGSAPSVLASNDSWTTWTSLVTEKALAATPAGQTCVIGSLDAIADAGSTPIVGASCREPDQPGVFVDSDRQWHLADIPVPPSLAHDEFATFRLTGSSALLAGVRDKRTSIVAAWAPGANRPWVLSPALPIGATSNLLATGSGPGETQFVVVRDGSQLRAEVVDGPGAQWQVLRALPTRTATIAIGTNGQIDALSVDITKLSVWRLGGNDAWVKAQTITVPIAFGSSA